MGRLRNIGRLRAGGSGFNPLSLFAAGEQGAWYSPDDFSTQFQDSAGTTPVTAVGQPVGKVLDKSGRGNHLIQATVAARPTLQQDGGGFYYWNFDGVDDCLASSAAVDLSAISKLTYWAGSYKGSDAAIGIFVEHSANGDTLTGTFYLAKTTTPTYQSVAKGATGQSVRSWAAAAGPDWRVISAALDLGGATIPLADAVRANAVTPTTTDTGAIPGGGNFISSTLNFGARNKTSLFWTGRMYQFILRGAASTAAEIAVTERFVGTKIGIAL